MTASLVGAPSASAAVRNFVGPNGGGWGTAGYWSPSGVPATGDDAVLTPVDGVSRVVNYANGNAAIQLGTVRLGASANAVVTLRQSKDTLRAGYLILGGANGRSGAYELSGGVLNTSDLAVGLEGFGKFTQTGGTLEAGSTLLVSAANGEAVFTHGGGTHRVSGHLLMGYFNRPEPVTYTMSGAATLQVAGRLIVGNLATAVFSQAAGQVTAKELWVSNQYAGNGTYALSGGSVSVNALSVGDGGTGRFTQSGGVVTVANDLNVANGDGNTTGSYTLSGGGTLDVTGTSFVGSAGGGTFIQTGGAHRTGQLDVGTWDRTPDRYELAAGELTVRGDEHVDLGEFVQSGGVHDVRGALHVGFTFVAGALFSLSGGTLTAGQVYVAPVSSGRGRLSIGGGTFHAGSKLTLTGPYNGMDVTGGAFDVAATSNDATITQSGGQVSLGDVTGSWGTISVSGGRMTMGSVAQASLTLDGTADVRLGSGTVASRLQALSIGPSASLDLAGGRMALNYSGATPAGAVREVLRRGRAGGEWDGSGLRSSAAAQAPGTAVGYAEAAALLGLSGTATRVWFGQSVDATTVLLRWTLEGDATMDGSVDFSDLTVLAQNYNSPGAAAVWSRGDFDYDGNVDFTDLVMLAQNYNASLPGPAVLSSTFGGEFARDFAVAFAHVPEPIALAPALLAGLAARRPRRRTRA